MLQNIRDRASGPLAYIVVGVIAVVFGVWGIGSYFTPSSNPVVASAAGTDITHSQLQQAFQQRYQRLQQMLGDQFDASRFPRSQVQRNVLDNLIDQAVMTHYARSAGYEVTDANLLAQIRSNPQFQDSKGQFSAQRYRDLLGQAGIKPGQYEARLRRSLLSDQPREIVVGSAFAAPPAVDAFYRRIHEKRRIQVLRINPAAYSDQVTIADGAVKSYYDKHGKQFMRPAQVRLSYVELAAGQLNPSGPDQSTLQHLYKTHKKALGQPATRSAEELKIPLDNDDAKARQTAQAAFKAAQQGTAFKQIASGMSGVDYATITQKPQSALPDALGAALFGLKSGGLSNPVKGDQAWYLLRLTGATPAQTPSFDDPSVQQRLKAMAHKQAVAQAFKKASDKLDDLAYQAPNGLQTISKQLGLKVRKTGWITRHGDTQQGLGQYQAVRKAAFSDDVLHKQLNSKVIDIGNRRRVVLRVADKQPPKRRPLAEVRDRIHDKLVQEKAADRAREAAQKAMSAARSGTSLSALAGQIKGAHLVQPGFVGRQSDQLGSDIIQAAFDLPVKAGDGSKPAYRVVETGQGDVALVSVDAVKVPSSPKGSQAEQAHQQLAQHLSGYNGQLEYQALDHYLRKKASVTIHENMLD